MAARHIHRADPPAAAGFSVHPRGRCVNAQRFASLCTARALAPQIRCHKQAPPLDEGCPSRQDAGPALLPGAQVLVDLSTPASVCEHLKKVLAVFFEEHATELQPDPSIGFWAPSADPMKASAPLALVPHSPSSARWHTRLHARMRARSGPVAYHHSVTDAPNYSHSSSVCNFAHAPRSHALGTSRCHDAANSRCVLPREGIGPPRISLLPSSDPVGFLR